MSPLPQVQVPPARRSGRELDGQQGRGLTSQREAQRLAVLQGVKGTTLSLAQAAQQLDLSVRQIKRLCRRLREEGAGGLISKRRGVPSNRRIAGEVREHTLGLVRQHCADFGPELAREYLASQHGFEHSTETLRGWMIAAGLWKPKTRRAKRVHPLRPRRECLSERVQIDGSHHDWFEARGGQVLPERLHRRRHRARAGSEVRSHRDHSGVSGRAARPHRPASVNASTNVLSSGRFQNADGFASELARNHCRRSARRPASGVGLVLAAVALALDQDGLDVVSNAAPRS